MPRFKVFPYNMVSEGAIALAEGLECLRIRLQGSTYLPVATDVVVNWGNGNSRSFAPAHVVNPDVNVCINKVTFFERMQGQDIAPPFALNKAEAQRHLSYPIICRTSIEGADGAGIVIANNADELVEARLYTQLMDKLAEYRVHMGRMPDGTIELICAQKKRVSASHGSNPIWTGDNTFLDWCDPVALPRSVFEKTKQAMELMPELHFGGFDTITTHGSTFVVEVNSAPMMTPDTTTKYVEFLKRWEVQANAVAIVAPFEEDPTETPDYQAGYTAGYAECLAELERTIAERRG